MIKKIETVLKYKFNNKYTPMVIIFDNEWRLKYWRTFHVKDMNYEKPYINFINSLGGIL